MNFEFTSEQQEIRKMVRDFAREVILPKAAEIDEKDEFPREIIRQMGNLGMMGLPIPEEWGGVGADFVSYILAIEEISYACAAIGVILAVHTSVGTFPILYFGTEEQKQKYIPKLAQGEWIGAFALTEPGAGSDASSIRTRAVRDGDSYVLNGSKMFITNGGEADVYCVFAVTRPEKGSRGITAFLVEKDTPGFRIGRKERKMGLHGSSTVELLFEDARVPVANRLGEEGAGFSIAMRLLDTGRIGIAAQAQGIARAAFDAANQYVRGRKQFNQSLFDFQAVQFMLADMATKIEASHWLIYNAANRKMRNLPCAKEASMAKVFASDAAMQITTDAVQLFGGYGYIADYHVERLMRDAKVTQIYEGTNQIQRIVIARHI
ncbi:acyl-CoA dehydrogenase [Alicyclobacillus tolerans]|uniref:Alkylation response protein AidB-like acyl-CoA dehydrogenase n=2 Tax=Alicyclobacillus tolerans TaxID=90970 RepID=A0ABT9LU56_9BACL|nr:MULTISPECIES: acyl-CoA dehydrogenase [Alicyclobacillus]MDP9727795.1 alkylation response protein AidB-like acyl-CoA dehydrogenase [Alicyclobacillus tengchongensis]SHK84183.1 butyryl-CoA dehydrogenase [Alicyclobacillus montanus]